MTPNPTIAQAKDLKHQLEQAIEKLLNDYTKATGLQIESVRITPVQRLSQLPTVHVYLDVQL